MSSSPYTRDNFFDSQEDEDYVIDDPPDRDWGPEHRFQDGVSRPEYLSHDIMKSGAGRLLDREALVAPPWNGGRLAELCAWLFDDECIDGGKWAVHHENRAVELTEPEVHVPKTTEKSWGEVDYGQRRHRSRYNPEHGYLDTATIIEDVSLEQFLEKVDAVLQCAREDPNVVLRDREAETLRGKAHSMKVSRDDLHDTDVMEEIVRALLWPDGVEDYFSGGH